MSTPVLLVATATRWYGTARVPRSLAKAGCEVSLLAPKGTLAEKSRFVAKIGHLPDDANPMQWTFAFAAIVKATSPRLIVPCDDVAFRLLQMLVTAPPPGMQPAMQQELAARIVESLGDPAHYQTSVDKTLLPSFAQSIGIRVPKHAIVETLGEAEAFARANGYPVVLKRNHSSHSSGVAVCADRPSLEHAFVELLRAGQADFDKSGSPKIIAQAYVDGTTKFYPSASFKGELVAGFAGEKLVGFGDAASVTTVNRYHRDAAMREVSSKLARALGITGFYSLEFLSERSSGEPYLLEINRRLVGGAHRGRDLEVDHWAALLASIDGRPSPTRSDLDAGESHITVHFPQEWLRDPKSTWLRDYPVDVPWDDPELLDAMLRLRNDE
jgi:glutathione synthase/RimK-type ligase-like ATP-grasp enzyme